MSERPLPSPTPLAAPYWEACQRGVLAIQRCGACGRFVHFPEPACPACLRTDLAFEPVSGRGVVHTFSVVHRSFAPGYDQATPYVIAWVELVEQPGLRAFGNVLSDSSGSQIVHIGQAVEVCFEDRPGFGPIPQFRPAV